MKNEYFKAYATTLNESIKMDDGRKLLNSISKHLSMVEKEIDGLAGADDALKRKLATVFDQAFEAVDSIIKDEYNTKNERQVNEMMFIPIKDLSLREVKRLLAGYMKLPVETLDVKASEFVSYNDKKKAATYGVAVMDGDKIDILKVVVSMDVSAGARNAAISVSSSEKIDTVAGDTESKELAKLVKAVK